MHLMASHSNQNEATIQPITRQLNLGSDRSRRNRFHKNLIDRVVVSFSGELKLCGDRDSLQHRAKEISASSTSQPALTHATLIRLLASPRPANWEIECEAVGLRGQRV
jgi:hypothetical protein